VVAQACHGLGLATHAQASGFVETFGLDQGEGDLTFEACVPGEVDTLAGALAEELSEVVTASREGRGRGRRREGA
jgi:hypothetical protein